MKKEEKQILEGLVKLEQIPLLPETTEDNTPLTLLEENKDASPITLAIMREHPQLTREQVEEMLQEM